MKMDLLLDGELARWFLDRIAREHVGTIFVVNDEMAQRARAYSTQVFLENANDVDAAVSSVALSVHYPRILKPRFIARYQKIYNIHPGYLPYGRGFYPVFWALWENTPAGATFHEINAGIDEGNIVAQIQVPWTETDTGGSLYARVRDAEKILLMDAWAKLTRGETLRAFAQQGSGTYHARREFLALKQNAAWKNFSAEQLVKLARCLTFPGYSGLEIELGAQKFQLRLESL